MQSVFFLKFTNLSIKHKNYSHSHSFIWPSISPKSLFYFLKGDIVGAFQYVTQVESRLASIFPFLSS